MENYKKQLEEIIDMIDRIPDTCKSKPGFKNTVLTFFTIWSTNISQTQMLINKLTELTNGNIDHVM